MIGPYAVIGPHVTLRADVRVGAHAVIEGPAVIGPRTVVGPHTVLGTGPQDLRHDPTVSTTLEVGADNVFREHCTAHRGSSAGGGRTVIGDGGLFMAGSHVGHDACVGDGVVLANSVALGGHSQVGDRVVFGGLAAVHQHTRVGRLAMVAGGSMCTRDVPPFSMVHGDRARFVGLNRVGLQRAGVAAEAVARLGRAFRILYGPGLREARVTELIEAFGSDDAVAELVAFVTTSERGLVRQEGP